jgi:hypothetical protein
MKGLRDFKDIGLKIKPVTVKIDTSDFGLCDYDQIDKKFNEFVLHEHKDDNLPKKAKLNT